MLEDANDGWTPGPSPGRQGFAFNLKHLIARGRAAWERDDYASALADFEEILAANPDFPDVRNWAGVCRAMLGHPDRALDEFDQAIRLNPRYADAHLNRVVILSELGRSDEAGESVDRLRELDAAADDSFPAELGNRIAVDHSRLGDLYMQAGRAEDAVEEYRKALEIRPWFVDIRNRLAQGFVAMGELEDAVDELTLVLAEHPSFLDARVRLGALLLRMGRRDDAIAEWRRCLEMDPHDRRSRAYLISAGVQFDEVEVSPV
ncbi:MAG: tetratricopeptide repeat protein [Gemmatimonadota bacterium]